MSAPPTPPPASTSAMPGFLLGLKTAVTSVFALVISGTYVGFGALVHDVGLSLEWAVLSTVLVWAAPAQVILVTTLGAKAALVEIAIAVGLSAVRLLPMVVALLPLLRDRRTTQWRLILPAHFTAVSMWVEALRHLPKVPREQRIGFANGLGLGMVTIACIATSIGFQLAGRLPMALAAGLLFLTPMSFLVSVARNATLLVDRLALAFGLAIGPVLASAGVGFDLLWTGVVGGTLAYAVHRLRTARP